MATDSTHLRSGDTSSESDTDMAGAPEFGSVQLAAAKDEPVQVKMPNGNERVVIPVKPGETIVLPTDSPDGLLAKLGADGNLAIVIDGRTIILKGYAEANEAAPIKIVTNDGDAVDITDVLASTLPDLDIQTAAGPGAVGPQGNTTPGSGIFIPFGPAAALGGFDAEGPLKGTALGYKLIDDERKYFKLEEKDAEPPHPPTIDFFPNDPEVKNGRAVVSEEGLKGGLKDSDPSPDDETNEVVASGTFVVSDPDAGDALTVALLTDGLPGKLGNSDVDWFAVDDHTVVGKIGGVAAITIEIDLVNPADQFNYKYEVTLNQALDHLDPSIEDEINFAITVKVTDSTGLSDTAELAIQVEDDRPAAHLADAQRDELVLDESETGKDTPVAVPPVGLHTVTADFSDNFEPPKFGGDGPGDVDYKFELSANGIGSGLFALDASDVSDKDGDGIGQGDEIVLNRDPGTGDILGQVGKDTYFTISVDANGIVTFTQQKNIWHDDPSAPDDAETLTTHSEGQLKLTQTVTDHDGDHDSKSLDLGAGVFTIQDDGPLASVENATVTAMVLDESPLPADGDGINSVTVDLSGNFGAVLNFGTDGPGDEGYKLELSADGIESGLFALDPNQADGKGAPILLSASADGSVITGSVGGTTYFTISVDADGKVTFERNPIENIWHDNTSDHDDPETLTTEDPLDLKLTQTLTDADGDTDSASIPLGAGVFTVQDDGPDAKVENAAVDAMILDESPLPGAGDGINKVTVDLSGNFGAILDFGTDGPSTAPGSKSEDYKLELSADGIGSGLFALDPTQADGKGAQILLSSNVDGSIITGSVGVTIYFTISVDEDGKVTFERNPSENIWHDNTSDHDDPETLTTANPDDLKLTQTLTDADGDHDSDSLNLGAGVFTIEDDGPTANLPDATAEVFLLDESPLPTDGDGINKVTHDLSVNFGAILDFGTDGPSTAPGVKSEDYKFELSANGIGSGLFALDPVQADGKGAQILLSSNVDGSIITGSVGVTIYFTISVDEDGNVTFERNPSENIWHDNISDHDDPETLTTANPDDLKLTQTLTDADGDHDSKSLNLGAGVFTIEDDGPDAVNDKDSVTEDDFQGGFVYATGNVITAADGGLGTDANKTDGVADDAGTDDLRSIAWQDVDNGTVDGKWGTLSVDADGNYKYDLNNDLKEVQLLKEGQELTETFTYTITDNDGDTDTATLTITIVGTNDGPDIDLKPEDPAAEDNTSVVSDEGLKDGLPDSDPANDDTDKAVFTHAFTISDPDGDPLTVKIITDVNTLPAWTFGGTNDPVVWTLSNGDKTLTGTANGEPAITVEFDTTTMIYTVTLLQPLNHPNTNIEDELTFNLTVEVSDGQATDTAVLTVEVEDDSPTITKFEVKAALIVDETDGVTANANETDPLGSNLGVATLAASALFDLTSFFGGDGPKDVDHDDVEDPDAIAYELDVLVAEGANSNITDTLSGDLVTLHTVSATKIEGRVGALVVFDITIDANTGQTTLTQYRAVVHGNPNDPDESATPVVLANDLVGVKVTVTDGDLDHVSQTANLNNVIKFEDDGPTISSFTVKAGAALIVDETDGVAANANETDPAGGNLGVSTLAASALFDLTSAFGQDGPKDADDNNVEDPDAIAYELDVLVAEGANSNITDTLSGDLVTLHTVSATKIEGRVGALVVFDIAIDANTGQTTLTQYRAVVHGNPNDPDESATPVVLANDLVGVKVTVTDGDLDHVSQTANLNNVIKFEDDGPTISSFTVKAGAALIVDETDGVAANANETDPAGGNLGVSTLAASALFDLTSAFGQDGPKDADDNNVEDPDAIAYELDVLVAEGANSNITDTLSGDLVTLHTVSATKIEGRVGALVVFDIAIDAETGQTTLTQYRAVVHGNPNDPDESATPVVLANDLVGVKVTVTDGDLDHVSQTANLNNVIKFEDDGPTISSFTVKAGAALIVDETDGVVANANETDAPGGNLGSATLAASALFDLTSAFGQDGPKDADDNNVEDPDAIAYELDVLVAEGANSNITDTLTGSLVTLHTVSATKIEGRVGALVVFDITIDADTGQTTLTQYRAVVHGDPTDPDEADTPVVLGNDLVGVKVTVTDGDLDHVSQTANLNNVIKFEDDGPAIIASTDVIYANSSNPTPGGTGIFEYDIGEDGRTTFSKTNSDFVLPVLTGTVGAGAISSAVVTWTSEDATDAEFDFSFKYAANPSTPLVLSEATGTLVFDKVLGTYTVQLDEPLEGFTVVSTRTAVDVQGYDAGGSKEDNSGPADVFVAQLSSDFFVQFTGAQPSLTAGGNGAFVSGELFAGKQADVIVSSTDMGVGSNTIQSGEVLDLNFYSTNPTGNLGQPTTASKDTMFMQFFGIGTADIVILLKLQSASNPGVTTTKTLVVENGDFFQAQTAALTALGITLGNNESAIIIESNDYNFGLEDYKITGMQILSAVDGITGTGINLNPATGAGGASPEPLPEPATQPLSTADGQVLKVVNIGFADTTSNTLDGNLHFDVAVKDGDSDVTSTTTLDLNIVGGSTFTGTASAESIHGSAGHDTITGGGGNDIIEGGAGNDTIDSAAAGAGNDTITGGAGIDTIDVSQGNDTITYTSKLDGSDIITGFDADPAGGGQDVINLDVLFDNYGAMSGTRASHVNVADSGTDTLVQIDTNNNVVDGYEMVITLKSVADHTTVTVGTDVVVGS